MSYFRYTQSIFQCNIDFDNNLVIDNTHLYTLVEMFRREEHRLPITKARRSDANDTIAFTDGLDSNSVNSVGQDFYLTKRARRVVWLDDGGLWYVHIFFSSSGSPSFGVIDEAGRYIGDGGDTSRPTVHPEGYRPFFGRSCQNKQYRDILAWRVQLLFKYYLEDGFSSEMNEIETYAVYQRQARLSRDAGLEAKPLMQ